MTLNLEQLTELSRTLGATNQILVWAYLRTHGRSNVTDMATKMRVADSTVRSVARKFKQMGLASVTTDGGRTMVRLTPDGESLVRGQLTDSLTCATATDTVAS